MSREFIVEMYSVRIWKHNYFAWEFIFTHLSWNVELKGGRNFVRKYIVIINASDNLFASYNDAFEDSNKYSSFYESY